jgi:hypothetical protein
MPNVKQLTLAHEVFHRTMRNGAQHEIASRLVASPHFRLDSLGLPQGWQSGPENLMGTARCGRVYPMNSLMS